MGRSHAFSNFWTEAWILVLFAAAWLAWRRTTTENSSGLLEAWRHTDLWRRRSARGNLTKCNNWRLERPICELFAVICLSWCTESSWRVSDLVRSRGRKSTFCLGWNGQNTHILWLRDDDEYWRSNDGSTDRMTTEDRVMHFETGDVTFVGRSVTSSARSGGFFARL